MTTLCLLIVSVASAPADIVAFSMPKAGDDPHGFAPLAAYVRSAREEGAVVVCLEGSGDIPRKGVWADC